MNNQFLSNLVKWSTRCHLLNWKELSHWMDLQFIHKNTNRMDDTKVHAILLFIRMYRLFIKTTTCNYIPPSGIGEIITTIFIFLPHNRYITQHLLHSYTWIKTNKEAVASKHDGFLIGIIQKQTLIRDIDEREMKYTSSILARKIYRRFS